MKLAKKLSDFLSLPAWKLIYDKNFNKHLKSEAVPYKVISGYLTQTGTNAPSFTILQNDFEINPSTVYNGIGNYSIDLSDFNFESNKVFVFGNYTFSIAGIIFIIEYTVSSSDEIIILSQKVVSTGGDLETNSVNELLNKSFIEIRIYN